MTQTEVDGTFYQVKYAYKIHQTVWFSYAAEILRRTKSSEGSSVDVLVEKDEVVSKIFESCPK